MVKHGCCGSNQASKLTAVAPAPDSSLRCRNSHPITQQDSSKQCFRTWKCDVCGQPCVERWKCKEACDYDVCETCFHHHWVNLVSQAAAAKSVDEALEMLKAVHLPERKMIEAFRAEADRWVKEGVNEASKDGQNMRGVLAYAVELGVQPPAACSVALSRAVTAALKKSDEALCREHVKVAVEFMVKPVAEELKGLALSAAQRLCKIIAATPAEKNQDQCRSHWQEAARCTLLESGSRELKQAAQAGNLACRAKIAELKDDGKDDCLPSLADSSFETAWEAVLNMVESSPTGTLDILKAVPETIRSKMKDNFLRIADIVVESSVLWSEMTTAAVFPDVVAEALDNIVALGLKVPACRIYLDTCSYVTEKICAAAQEENRETCASGIELATKYKIEPAADFPMVTFAALMVIWEQSRHFSNLQYESKAKALISSMANDEVKSAIAEGLEATKARFNVLLKVFVDLDKDDTRDLLMLDTWLEVVRLSMESSDESVLLLKSVPLSHRLELGDVFTTAAESAVLRCASVSDSLVRCRELGVELPSTVKDGLLDELCEKLPQKDKKTITELLKNVADCNMDIEPSRLSGDDMELEAIALLLECWQACGMKPQPWTEAVTITFANRAGEEMDALLRSNTRGVATLVKIVARAGMSVASLPDAVARAPSLLAAAVLAQSQNPSEAQDLATLALECDPDTDRLLASVAENDLDQARGLLGIYNSSWFCAPNGDSETPDDRWVEFPSEFSKKVEQGYSRRQATNANGTGCKKRVEVNIKEQVAKFALDSKFAVDFAFMTCMVTEPEKRGRVVPIRRYKDGELTDPPKGSMHPWYVKQVQDKDAKDGDWLSNAYFFTAFTDALKNAGITVENPPEEMFDFRFNEDFRDKKDDGRHMYRGGQEYRLPFGWKRFAVNVKGEYDEGDNKWLGNGDGSWAIAYHGTAEKNLPNILSTGFRVGPRQKFSGECGSGVYCTPFVDVGAHYASASCVKGHNVQIVLQLRVKPSEIKPVTTGSDFEKKYWVINNPKDMRAYGVLVREAKS